MNDTSITVNPEPEPQPVERRSEERPFVPVWLRRAREGALYGYDAEGNPIAKDMSGTAAA